MTYSSFETAAMLHCRLQELYREAKLEHPDISDVHHMELDAVPGTLQRRMQDWMTDLQSC